MCSSAYLNIYLVNINARAVREETHKRSFQTAARPMRYCSYKCFINLGGRRRPAGHRAGNRCLYSPLIARVNCTTIQIMFQELSDVGK